MPQIGQYRASECRQQTHMPVTRNKLSKAECTVSNRQTNILESSYQTKMAKTDLVHRRSRLNIRNDSVIHVFFKSQNHT